MKGCRSAGHADVFDLTPGGSPDGGLVNKITAAMARGVRSEPGSLGSWPAKKGTS